MSKYREHQRDRLSRQTTRKGKESRDAKKKKDEPQLGNSYEQVKTRKKKIRGEPDGGFRLTKKGMDKKRERHKDTRDAAQTESSVCQRLGKKDLTEAA